MSDKKAAVSSKVEQFASRCATHEQMQRANPFSGRFERAAPSNGGNTAADFSEYGKPLAGSRTERRGIEAHQRIGREIYELVDVIQRIGVRQADGTMTVTFGHLFDTYTAISNKLVGVLMRARKYGLVQFEGEMLFQRRDDDKQIVLIALPERLALDHSDHGNSLIASSQSSSAPRQQLFKQDLPFLSLSSEYR